MKSVATAKQGNEFQLLLFASFRPVYQEPSVQSCVSYETDKTVFQHTHMCILFHAVPLH